MNESQVIFHNQDIDFNLNNSEVIANKLIEFAISKHNSCGTINYIFCTDDFLLELNRQYLRHDYYTDILSFQMNDDPVSGDIYISIDRVKENANYLEVTFENELQRVISHGMLHFLGYKDKTEEEQQEMRAKENELINFLNTK